VPNSLHRSHGRKWPRISGTRIELPEALNIKRNPGAASANARGELFEISEVVLVLEGQGPGLLPGLRVTPTGCNGSLSAQAQA